MNHEKLEIHADTDQPTNPFERAGNGRDRERWLSWGRRGKRLGKTILDGYPRIPSYGQRRIYRLFPQSGC